MFLEAKVTEPNKRGNIGLFRQRSSFNGSVLNGISLKSKYQMLLLAIALSLEITNKENCFEKQGLDFKTQNVIDKMSKKWHQTSLTQCSGSIEFEICFFSFKNVKLTVLRLHRDQLNQAFYITETIFSILHQPGKCVGLYP